MYNIYYIMYISIHISCTYISLYLVSYDAIILICILSYEAQWPGFTPFPPLTLFLLRSSAWSTARVWRGGGGRPFWNSPSWESTLARTMKYQCCLLETPGTIITKETFPCRLLTKAFLLENTIFSKCLKEKDYENWRSMRGPGMSGPLFFQAKICIL